jgi:hypothetical protein
MLPVVRSVIVKFHGAKLQKSEQMAAKPDSLLAEDYRPWRNDLDVEQDHDHERREQQKRCERSSYVHGSFPPGQPFGQDQAELLGLASIAMRIGNRFVPKIRQASLDRSLYQAFGEALRSFTAGVRQEHANPALVEPTNLVRAADTRKNQFGQGGTVFGARSKERYRERSALPIAAKTFGSEDPYELLFRQQVVRPLW